MRKQRNAMDQQDVIVVGAGNAALCAALSAREAGARVTVLERAPVAERGGNSTFTAGAIRVAYGSVDDLVELIPDLSEEEKRTTDFGTYTEDQYFDDMARVTQHRGDPDLVELLVRRSHATLKWLRGKGVRFVPIYGRQAFKVGGRFKFWGGLTVEASGGGPGLVEALHKAAERAGIEVLYEARAVALLADDRGVGGVRVRQQGKTGDGIRMALEIGAQPRGNWSGCHAVSWDRNAPEFGDLAVGDQFQKHSYPFGIMINARGERFVDEGAEFRNYTYAKYGRAVLEQPGQFAWQVFDQKVAHLLRDEYRIRQITKVEADTIERLAERLDDVDKPAFLRTVAEFNRAVRHDIPFDPNVKDGRAAAGLKIPKSNWANTIDTPPFLGFAVTCGITFTFGGLRITNDAQVVDTDGAPIPGLYAAGELVGGLFYFNYPGGTGLMSGAVFGKIAGASAALAAQRTPAAAAS